MSLNGITSAALSGLQTAQTALSVVSNNVTNMNTPGYRAQNALFTDYLTGPKDKGGIDEVVNAGSYTDNEPASISLTESISLTVRSNRRDSWLITFSAF